MLLMISFLILETYFWFEWTRSRNNNRLFIISNDFIL